MTMLCVLLLYWLTWEKYSVDVESVLVLYA